jgi:hypothetical protein
MLAGERKPHEFDCDGERHRAGAIVNCRQKSDSFTGLRRRDLSQVVKQATRESLTSDRLIHVGGQQKVEFHIRLQLFATDRFWSGAGAAVIEIVATLLTVKLLVQCRVWSKQFRRSTDSCQSFAVAWQSPISQVEGMRQYSRVSAIST